MRIGFNVINKILLSSLSNGGLRRVSSNAIKKFNKELDDKVDNLFNIIKSKTTDAGARQTWKKYKIQEQKGMTYFIENSHDKAYVTEFGSLHTAPDAPIRTTIQSDPLNFREMVKNLRESVRRGM